MERKKLNKNTIRKARKKMTKIRRRIKGKLRGKKKPDEGSSRTYFPKYVWKREALARPNIASITLGFARWQRPTHGIGFSGP